MVCRGTPSCISFDSYIKPQPIALRDKDEYVVYLLIPTSNHNFESDYIDTAKVVYLLIPTSNHNGSGSSKKIYRVVYLLIPTSNHNLVRNSVEIVELYIF